MATRTNHNKPKPLRIRIVERVIFDVPRDNAIMDEIDALKERRVFKPTLIDGIRLMLDLRKGQTEVLNELFPWVLKKTDSEPVVVEPTNSNDDLKRQLARLERLLLDQKPSELPAGVKAAPKPQEDWSTLEVTQAKSDENPGFNLMISMAALTGKWGDLPTEVLTYGQARGRIPASVETTLKEREKAAVAKIATTETTGNAKVMDVPQFDAPSEADFEDLDIPLNN